MDYGSVDVLSTSQGRPAADASLGVTYRTIWGRPEDNQANFQKKMLEIFCEIFYQFSLTRKSKNYQISP